MPSEAVYRGVTVAPMELAALVHEESSYLAARVRQQAIRAVKMCCSTQCYRMRIRRCAWRGS